MHKTQQPKPKCVACRKRPATVLWVDADGRANVCGFCYRSIRADAQHWLKLNEQLEEIIAPDAWNDKKEQR